MLVDFYISRNLYKLEYFCLAQRRVSVSIFLTSQSGHFCSGMPVACNYLGGIRSTLGDGREGTYERTCA